MTRKLVLRATGAVLGSALMLATAFQAEAAPRRGHRGGGNGAAAAFAFGAVALGIGAAIAASQRRERETPVYAYGYPAYGYGYANVAPQYYAPQPVYAPGYGYGHGNRWGHRRHQNLGF